MNTLNPELYCQICGWVRAYTNFIFREKQVCPVCSSITIWVCSEGALRQIQDRDNCLNLDINYQILFQDNIVVRRISAYNTERIAAKLDDFININTLKNKHDTKYRESYIEVSNTDVEF